MSEIVVSAQTRSETGKNVNRRLRATGLIPGTLYGASRKPMAVAVSPKAITSILRSATGENTLFELELDGQKRKVILKLLKQSFINVGVTVEETYGSLVSFGRGHRNSLLTPGRIGRT